jgi:hypothetical protein
LPNTFVTTEELWEGDGLQNAKGAEKDNACGIGDYQRMEDVKEEGGGGGGDMSCECGRGHTETKQEEVV